MTYGQIAMRIGDIRLAQVVGWALHSNPDPRSIPCHRVVSKIGCIAEHFGQGGWKEQKRRLRYEGIIFIEEKRIELKKYLWKD